MLGFGLESERRSSVDSLDSWLGSHESRRSQGDEATHEDVTPAAAASFALRAAQQPRQPPAPAAVEPPMAARERRGSISEHRAGAPSFPTLKALAPLAALAPRHEDSHEPWAAGPRREGIGLQMARAADLTGLVAVVYGMERAW